ncbi:MAG: TetR/AcrR family transcriptional regulator [Gemmiger formicilis]|uniref:TetR/AcrR family transcriptional regulator n=1 Tax=Gemmiger formicilis TaxID=745368 RepID=UPI003A3FA8E6
MNESKLDVKKRAVIEIAENLFLSQGLATTEMKEIARCASISRSTLYRMFDSRETLAFAVADKCLHELFDPKPMEIYGTDRSGFEILRSYSSNLIETMIQGVRYVKYLSEFDQMFSGDYPDTPEARKYVQFNRQRHDRQILLNILRLGTEDGSIRGDIDANMLELTIGNTLLGVAQRILPREKNYQQEYGYGREILYNVMELMLEGVRNKDA